MTHYRSPLPLLSWERRKSEPAPTSEVAAKKSAVLRHRQVAGSESAEAKGAARASAAQGVCFTRLARYMFVLLPLCWLIFPKNHMVAELGYRTKERSL